MLRISNKEYPLRNTLVAGSSKDITSSIVQDIIVNLIESYHYSEVRIDYFGTDCSNWLPRDISNLCDNEYSLYEYLPHFTKVHSTEKGYIYSNNFAGWLKYIRSVYSLRKTCSNMPAHICVLQDIKLSIDDFKALKDLLAECESYNIYIIFVHSEPRDLPDDILRYIDNRFCSECCEEDCYRFLGSNVPDTTKCYYYNLDKPLRPEEVSVSPVSISRLNSIWKERSLRKYYG